MDPLKFLIEIEKRRKQNKCSIYTLVVKIIDDFEKNCRESISKMSHEIVLLTLKYVDYKKLGFNDLNEFHTAIISILKTKETPINDYKILCERRGNVVNVKAKIKDLGDVYTKMNETK